MTKFFTITIIVSVALVIFLSACAPELLASNTFLVGFVNHELLNILAVIATVTIASAANIHLAFNRLEEKAGKIGAFTSARKEVSGSALILVWLFLAAIFLLVVKSLGESDHWLSFWNGAALVILMVNIFVLIDITTAVFKITPIPNSKQNNE